MQTTTVTARAGLVAPAKAARVARKSLAGARCLTPASAAAALRPRRAQAAVARRARAGVKVSAYAVDGATEKLVQPGTHLEQVSMVYKFGGSSVRDAERMREVASIVCSFPEHFPACVLSAMGKTTNNLLAAGAAALSTQDVEVIHNLPPLCAIRDLHRETIKELNVDAETAQEVEVLLGQLEKLLVGISMLQELTPRAKDSLVSFGERMSTRIFAGFLRAEGVDAKQYDAFEMGFTTDDEFVNATIDYDVTLPAIQAALTRKDGERKALPIVTGFLGKGVKTGAITTLGRGGSDLSCTTIGAALGLPEVQVWKDVDGVLTTDPRIVVEATPVPELTFEEATELAFFGAKVLHPAAMVPAQRSGKLGVRVKNSYNRMAPGTVIAPERDMNKGPDVTSLVLKDGITLFDIVSTRMLGNHGFLAKVFDVFRDHKISVDVVATSEISVSLTLDTAKIWDEELTEQELEALAEEFKGVATTATHRNVAILTLICNAEKSSDILQHVFKVLSKNNINVYMMSQGASKHNIALVIDNQIAQYAVQLLHDEFFGTTESDASVWSTTDLTDVVAPKLPTPKPHH